MKRQVEKILMVINVKWEIIDILQITNRRFMYNPQTGTLILGDEIYVKPFAVPIHKSSMRQEQKAVSMIICAGGLAHRKATLTGLSILPPPSSWNSSTEGLTHYKCSPDLKA